MVDIDLMSLGMYVMGKSFCKNCLQGYSLRGQTVQLSGFIEHYLQYGLHSLQLNGFWI